MSNIEKRLFGWRKGKPNAAWTLKVSFPTVVSVKESLVMVLHTFLKFPYVYEHQNYQFLFLPLSVLYSIEFAAAGVASMAMENQEEIDICTHI